MVSLIDLWLPILLSAVGVFVVSSVIHMLLPVHRSDYSHVADEEAVLGALRDAGVRRGNYMFPGCNSMKDMGNPEYIEKCKRGPVGYLSVLPNGMWNMGKGLGQWFVFSLVVSVCTAYVATFTLEAGSEFMPAFRLTGTVAFMAYALGVVPNSIWKGTDWSTTGKFIVDGLCYGLTTGAIFAWLWPSGPVG